MNRADERAWHKILTLTAEIDTALNAEPIDWLQLTNLTTERWNSLKYYLDSGRADIAALADDLERIRKQMLSVETKATEHKESIKTQMQKLSSETKPLKIYQKFST